MPRWLRAWVDLYVDTLTRLSHNLNLQHHEGFKKWAYKLWKLASKYSFALTHSEVRTKLTIKIKTYCSHKPAWTYSSKPVAT